jgi:type IV secretory pathway VirB10-like protein
MAHNSPQHIPRNLQGQSGFQMRQFNLRLLLPLIAALLLPAAVQAGMYKWVDPQGVTHYGDQPPPGQAAQPVTPPPPPASGSQAEEKSLMEQSKAADEARRKAQKSAAEAEQARQAAAKRAEHCKKVRERIDYMQSHPRLLVLKNGGPEMMPDEERQSQLADLEAEYAKNCSGQQ